MGLKAARAAPGNYCPDAGTNDGIIGLLSSWNLTSKEPYAIASFCVCPARCGEFFCRGGLRGRQSLERHDRGQVLRERGRPDWTVGALYNRDTRDRALNVGLLATGDSAFTNSRVEGG